jgi:predicted Zn-dependent protease
MRRTAALSMAVLLVAASRPAAAQPVSANPRPIAQAERALESGQPRLAASRFRALATADPSAPRPWYGLGKSYEALARDTFDRLQKAAPDSVWEALIVADVLVSGERFAQALSLYREIQQAAPDVGGVHEAVGDLYERAGKPDWAAVERAKVAGRTRDCAKHAAECAFLAGRFLDAVTATEGREDGVSLYWRTRAYNALATEAFGKLDALPPSAEVHRVRAAIHRDQGRPTEAVPELKAALALAPGDQAIEEEMAAALYESRNLDEALPLLARLAGPSASARPELAFFYGDALLQAQQVEQALPYLKAAAASRPDAAAVRSSLGRALLMSGDAAAALPHLVAAAAAADPESDGSAHYQLAQAYQRLGRQDEAKSALAEYQKRQAAHAAVSSPETPAGTTPEISPP